MIGFGLGGREMPDGDEEAVMVLSKKMRRRIPDWFMQFRAGLLSEKSTPLSQSDYASAYRAGARLLFLEMTGSFQRRRVLIAAFFHSRHVRRSK